MVGDRWNPDVRTGLVGVGWVQLASSVGVCFALLFAAFAGDAQAAPETIAGSGTRAGEVLSPKGTAVYQDTGDLYVTDFNFLSTGGTARVNKFDSQGNFLLAWGWGVRDEGDELQTCGPEAVPPTTECLTSPNANVEEDAGAGFPEAVAVDQSSGAVYVADKSLRRVTKFSSTGDFLFMVGKDVNQGGGIPSSPGNICTAQHLANGDTCGAGEVGTGPNEFSEPLSLAVDPSGVVWVGDLDRIASFSASGAAGSEIALPAAGATTSLALDSAGNFFVKSSSVEAICKLEAGTGTMLETLDATGQPRAVTLDEDDNVYIGDATDPYRFKVYNPSGEQISVFGAGEVIGSPKGDVLAIGEIAEKLYVASSRDGANGVAQAFPLPAPGPLVENLGVEDLLPTTATLTARINPEGDETTYRFEYGTTESYGQTTPLVTLSGSEFEGEDVQAQIAGLLPDTIYHVRVVATNHCNPSDPTEVCTTASEDLSFTTPPAVAIYAQWATDITAHTAIVHAELDPLGVEAEAWLEYGTDDGYGAVIPLANLGDGLGAVTRQVSLSGLQAGTTYYYRFVARDERAGVIYTVHGPDSTFTTQFGGLGFELADNRVWEMVSPSDKHGAALVGGGQILLQASVDGNGLAYSSRLSVEAAPEGNRVLETSMNLARRSDENDGAWHSEDITPPNDRATGLPFNSGSEYKLFNPGLSEALLEPRSGTPLSPEASERTPYLRENTGPPAFTPLLTGKEPYANVPPGLEFGGKDSTGPVKLVGVSPTFQHFALRSVPPLVEGAAVPAGAVYVWSDGQVKPISVLPADESEEMVAGVAGSDVGTVRGALSADGSRVFWSRGNYPALSGLYVRDAQAEVSGRLDLKQTGASGVGAPRPIFQGASSDGNVVFFTDSRSLTADASSNGRDLYRCVLPADSVAAGCSTLTNISVPTEAGESSEVEGIAAATTADGSAIYFVARGMLDEAPNQFGDSAIAGEPNLYLWQQGQGIRFIGTLADEDRGSWGKRIDGESGYAVQLSATASPSGRYLGFMSQRNLTGYDNRDATTGEPAQELFRYDALADRLECVSCNPTGKRPASEIPPQQFEALVNPWGMWEGMRAAATLPQATATALEGAGPSLYRPRAVLDNGRIFFNAIDALVPADSNGQWDVYQHEPTGVGDCLASSEGASISRSAGGCVSLISSGLDEEEAAFLDASETGDDAFFFTKARLSVLDQDEEIDIYDARVDGVSVTLPAISECLGEACQPPPQAPQDPTPASAAFNGPGNLSPAARKKCPKGKRRVRRQGRVRCIAKKQAPKGRQGQRKAGDDRRVTR